MVNIAIGMMTKCENPNDNFHVEDKKYNICNSLLLISLHTTLRSSS